MSDIKLTKDHDLEIINGEINLVSSKDEYIVQLVKIRLSTYQGEWYLNTSIGIPYFQTILKKGVDKTLVDSIFSKIIKDTAGVEKIVKFNSTVNDYEYNLSFTFQSIDGSILTVFESIAL